MTSLQEPTTPTAQYTAPLASPATVVRSDAAGPQDSKLRAYYRSWVALRWRLSASFFARPVPWFTPFLELKFGDLCITLPVAIVFLIVNAIGVDNKDSPGTGTLPSVTLMFVFALAVRNNALLLTLTGIPFERALIYHKLFAVVTIVLSALHGLAYLRDTEAESDKHSRVVTGAITFGLMVVQYLFSLSIVRRRFFELFIRMHWILFILIIVFAIIHGAAIALVGFVPWLLDLVFRLYYRAPKYKNGKSSNGMIAAQQVSVTKLPGNVVRIQFPRVRADTGEAFTFEAGQYAFLCVPSLSKLQWHPFTISSAPHEPLVTFHIKSAGDWTKALAAHVAIAPESTSTFEILVDGPYGSTSIDIENFQMYSHVVLIGGGIGVTPMQSIMNHLYYQRHHDERIELQKVKFVWSVRDRDMIKAILNQEVIDAKLNMAQGNTLSAYLPDTLLMMDQHLEKVFQTEIYLTSGDADLENPVDQMLKHCMRYNARPDIANTLRSMGELAQESGRTTVAVLVCGPDKLVEEVINQGMKLSSSMTIRFDVHTETFKF